MSSIVDVIVSRLFRHFESTISKLKCCIYAPDSPTKRSKVYYYVDTEQAKQIMETKNSGVLINTLAEAEWNNLKHLMYQPDEQQIKAALHIVD